MQRARHVIVAGYAIETPRLLLNSTSAQFPNGLANGSGVVGKYLMSQAGPVVWGRFDEPIRQYKAPPACACTEEFYETDPAYHYVRGYALQTVSPLPIAMAHVVAGNGAFGDGRPGVPRAGSKPPGTSGAPPGRTRRANRAH